MHHHSRRDFLCHFVGALSGGAPLLLQAALQARVASAQARRASAKLFDIRKVDNNAFLALARPALMLNCNAAIFRISDGFLIVDTHSKPSAAAALVAQIRREIGPEPVRYLVYTHHHYDHSQGTAGFRQLQPRPRILASSHTRDILADRGAAVVRQAVETMRERIEETRKRLEAKLSDPQRRFYRQQLAEARSFVEEMKDYQPELPDVTFDRDMIVHDKRQPLHLVFRGRAHTASDICVVAPDSRLIATGDLVTGFVPGMGDGFPPEWPETLRRLAELPFHRILPGHGDLQTGRERLFQLKAYIEELNELVAQGRRQGKPLAAIQNEVTPGSLRSFASSGYGDYLAQNTIRFRFRAPGADAAAEIASAVRSNVQASYEKLANV